MAKDILIEVSCKAGVTDPVGQGLANDIVHLGLAKVKSVSSAQLYRLSGTISTEDELRITRDLLCDPILNESLSRDEATQDNAITIDIWYKTGVTDVVGDSVRKGILDLDIHGVQSVRTGMRYHLHGVTRREVAEKIALALLVNPLVHESTIHAD